MRMELTRFWHHETGATAIEYALIASLVSIAFFAVAKPMGPTLVNIFEKCATALGNK
jgi:Flp pilus assembly pilin Flp